MNKNYKIILTIIIILALIACYILGYQFGKKKQQPANSNVIIRQIDTVFINQIDTILIPKTKIQTVEKEKIDTIIITRAFEKSFDTLINNSARVRVSYLFPQDSFRLFMNQYIKEIKTYDTIKINYPVPTFKTKDAIKWGGAGILSGLIIGIIITK